MTRRVLVVNAGLGAAVVVGGVFAAISLGAPGSSTANAAVQTATVQRGTVQSTTSGTGNLQSPSNLNVNFTTAGVLTGVYVKAGEHVKRGQRLAEIDPTTAKQGVASAENGLATAQAQ